MHRAARSSAIPDWSGKLLENNKVLFVADRTDVEKDDPVEDVEREEADRKHNSRISIKTIRQHDVSVYLQSRETKHVIWFGLVSSLLRSRYPRLTY